MVCQPVCEKHARQWPLGSLPWYRSSLSWGLAMETTAMFRVPNKAIRVGKSRAVCRRLWVLCTILCSLALSDAVNAQPVPVCPDIDFVARLTDNERERFHNLEDAPFSDGRYYEVEKDGARSTVLGTFHFPTKGNVLPDDLLDRVDAARVVILESAPDQASEFTADISLILKAVLNPAGPFLLPEFTLDEWTTITAAVARHGVPRLLVNQLEPWVVAVALIVPACDLPTSSGSPFGLDLQIFFHARDNNIPVRTLDTVAHIKQLVASYGDVSADQFAGQINYVRQTLAHRDFANAFINSHRLLYLDQRIMAIWAGAVVMMERIYGVQGGAKVAARIWQDLIVGRNTAWMKTLIGELETGNAVVAVGALHLPSEDGILRLLEREGFTVHAIPE